MASLSMSKLLEALQKEFSYLYRKIVTRNNAQAEETGDSALTSNEYFAGLLYLLATAVLGVKIMAMLLFLAFVISLGCRTARRLIWGRIISATERLHIELNASLPQIIVALVSAFFAGDRVILTLLRHYMRTAISIFVTVLLLASVSITSIYIITECLKEIKIMSSSFYDLCSAISLSEEWRGKIEAGFNATHAAALDAVDAVLRNHSLGVSAAQVEELAASMWNVYMYSNITEQPSWWINTTLWDLPSALNGDMISLDWTAYASLFLELVAPYWALLGNLGAVAASMGKVTMDLVIAVPLMLADSALRVTIFVSAMMIFLSFSKERYKPVEVVLSFFSTEIAQKFEPELEKASQGIIMATVKMFTFHFLFTWTSHQLFGLPIRALPALINGIFAAVPLVASHVLVLPSCLFIWLVHGNAIRAALMFLGHLLLSYTVDIAIYKGIEHSHPFQTALAIFGGVLVFGPQGIAFGPICFAVLKITLDMSKVIMHHRREHP